MNTRLFFAACCAALLGASNVFAQSRCFCLQNPASLMIERRGCEAREIPNRATERVICQTPDFTSFEPVPNHGDFTRLAGGDGQCMPCMASPVEAPDDSIRGSDDDGPEPAEPELELDG